jgi:hypothetical protein
MKARVEDVHGKLGRGLLKRLAGDTLSRSDSDDLYWAVDALVRSYTRKHYGTRPLSKDREDDHLDRVTLFWEYMRHIYDPTKDRGVGWFVSAYRRRFVELETVLELRKLGSYTPIESVRSTLIDWFAKVRRWGREGIPVNTVPEVVEAARQEFIRLNGREPKQSTLQVLTEKATWYILTDSKKHKVSLDALPSWMSPL